MTLTSKNHRVFSVQIRSRPKLSVFHTRRISCKKHTWRLDLSTPPKLGVINMIDSLAIDR